MIPGSKGLQWMLASNCMALGPAKHEQVAIFLQKNERIANVLGFREHEVRRNPWYHTFDTNVMVLYCTHKCGHSVVLIPLIIDRSSVNDFWSYHILNSTYIWC